MREEYGRLYGARHEAKFFAPKSIKSHEAKRLFGDWIAEVEGRIAAIRAARDGTGLSGHDHLVEKRIERDECVGVGKAGKRNVLVGEELLYHRRAP